MNQNVFVTGGAGYIGLNICLELLIKGYNVTIYDNFLNSDAEGILRVEAYARRQVNVIYGDIRDTELLITSLTNSRANFVIHLAGLKSIDESIQYPLNYYSINVNGTLSLLYAMQQVGLNKIIFSSSAAVYGNPKYLPICEDHPLDATSPYGRSKIFVEKILQDIHHAFPNWDITIFRYFNPVGAHESGIICDRPKSIKKNLFTVISQSLETGQNAITITGNDYPTRDGTCVRDFIHVSDLSKAHLSVIQNNNTPHCRIMNLGTGIGKSVLEIVATFEFVSNQKIITSFTHRRCGDVVSCYCNADLALKYLDWKASKDIVDMCRDSLNCSNKNFNV